MIVNLLINLVVLIIGSIFSWLPQVTTLPTIGGFDIDSAMVTGVSQLKQFMVPFWPISYMFAGFLFLMGYYSLKIGINFFFGHRTPGK